MSAQAELERLRASPRPRVLLVSHGERGGVARQVAALAESIAERVEVLHLRPQAPSHVRLEANGLTLFLESPREWERLVALLRGIGIDRLHLHHVHGFPREVLDLPERLGTPYDVTLHDYFAACPNYHLVDASGHYCASDPECGRCVDAHPAQWPVSIAQWRAAFDPFLQGAARVIAPSGDCARRIARFFPGVQALLWPHPEERRAVSAPLRVLVPGAISHAKGMDILEACVADAAHRALPLHFRVLGFLARKLAVWPQAPVSIRGEFPEGRLDELIALERGDVCFFPVQCPETFSYTLSSALDSGLPIVATDLGALPERLKDVAGARVLPWRASAAEMNDALLAAAPPRPQLAMNRPRTSFAAYGERYLAGITRAAHASDPLPPVDARWLSEPWFRPRAVPLAYLFEDGVECGKAESLERLRQYAFDPDSLYADADQRVRELIEERGRSR
jgi:glycosyltransferase involved in cell wall biosynthesis